MKQLPIGILKKAARGIGYISHPLRLRILEFLDVNGSSSVSAIAKGVDVEQLFVSQSLRKLREAHLVKTTRRGLFIYYTICEEYPASIFVCLRKWYGYLANDFYFLQDNYKHILPADFTSMAAETIKLFAHVDKMRILDFLILYGPSTVSAIAKGAKFSPLKVSQLLKRMRTDGLVISKRNGRFMIYESLAGIHVTAMKCIHRRYDSLKKKSDF
ncbi:MAG: transcriptional regulator [Alphaproteobacteria bacterium]|nr:transcriptional regulator [Alphaproteobacteria bacterium]